MSVIFCKFLIAVCDICDSIVVVRRTQVSERQRTAAVLWIMNCGAVQRVRFRNMINEGNEG